MTTAARIHSLPQATEAAALIDKARAMVPHLRQRADVTAQERKVHPDTIAEYRASGIARVLQPARFGGYGSDYTVFTRVIHELAQGCASSAWVYAVYGEHSWVVSMFPDEAQQDVWAKTPLAVSSSSFAPNGKARAVPGGFRLTGKWSFSSGCDYAEWVMLGAFMDDPAAPKDNRVFLVPMQDVRIEDDWFVLGLKGTGSKSLHLDDVFVPEHRSIWNRDLKAATAPGRAANPDFLTCSAPRSLFSPFTLSSVIVGLAQRATEMLVEFTQSRVSRGVRVADVESVQLRVAEATGEAETARLIIDETCRRNLADLAAGHEITGERVAWTRRNSVYAARLAHNAATSAFRGCGAAALYDRSPMQGIFRDATAAAAHLFLSWDRGATPYGQARLGQPFDFTAV